MNIIRLWSYNICISFSYYLFIIIWFCEIKKSSSVCWIENDFTCYGTYAIVTLSFSDGRSDCLYTDIIVIFLWNILGSYIIWLPYSIFDCFIGKNNESSFSFGWTISMLLSFFGSLIIFFLIYGVDNVGLFSSLLVYKISYFLLTLWYLYWYLHQYDSLLHYYQVYYPIHN